MGLDKIETDKENRTLLIPRGGFPARELYNFLEIYPKYLDWAIREKKPSFDGVH